LSHVCFIGKFLKVKVVVAVVVAVVVVVVVVMVQYTRIVLPSYWIGIAVAMVGAVYRMCYFQGRKENDRIVVVRNSSEGCFYLLCGYAAYMAVKREVTG
jgi:uncharacterized membrane protein HdeD (DUF308 family)